MGGIVDFEVRFPTSRADAYHMHTESGIPIDDILAITHTEDFPVLGDHEQAWELAAEAARAVLERNAVSPEEISHVIYTGSGEWDLPFWSPAARVALELDISRAHCFEVTNFCNGGMAAVRAGLNELAVSGGPFVLVLVGDRLSQLVDYQDPDSKALFNFGDAPSALLLGRGDCAFEVLTSSMRTDPSWADYYSGDVEDDRILMRRRGRRPGLADAYLENFPARIGEVLSTLGRDLSDVAYLLINQGDKGMHERLLNQLGIPARKSVFNYDRLGHMGGSDLLIALRGLMDDKRLEQGDLVLLASSGMGFTWAVTAVEYRGL